MLFMYLQRIITGDFLLLVLTITIEKVYSAFLSEPFIEAFTHDHPYTANFLVCAVTIVSFS